MLSYNAIDDVYHSVPATVNDAPPRQLFQVDSSLLSLLYHHPLDKTVYTNNQSGKWFVRWYSRSTPTETTTPSISVTQLVRTYYAHTAHGRLSRKPIAIPEHDEPDDSNLRDQGILGHKTIEHFLNRSLLLSHTPPGFQKWYEWFSRAYCDYKPFRTEMVLRSCAATRITGIVDAIFARRCPDSNTFRCVLVDWKFSDTIYPGTISFHCACLQLNIYQHLWNTYYAPVPIACTGTCAQVESMLLVVFRSGDAHDTYEVPSSPETCEDILRSHGANLLSFE